uniref:Uncharacterized protein n=1 Tax=Equus asinus TaxID=9793 RepID=A0A8C4LHB0_EQUAS
MAALNLPHKELPTPWEETSRVQKSFQEIYQSDSEGWESSKDLRGQLGHLESELSFLNTLTGINVRNYSKKTEVLASTEMTEKSTMKVLQRHRLSGNCHVATFQLGFQILGIQNEESSSFITSDLNMIMELTEYSELSKYVLCLKQKKEAIFSWFSEAYTFLRSGVNKCKHILKHLEVKLFRRFPKMIRLPSRHFSSIWSI